MKLRSVTMGVALALSQLIGADFASAATLWRGVFVITASAGSAACLDNYSVGGSADLYYRPNLGAPVDETMEIVKEEGAGLIASTDATNRTLRAGSLNIRGAGKAKGFEFNNANNPITITPASITAATVTIGMSGT